MRREERKEFYSDISKIWKHIINQVKEEYRSVFRRRLAYVIKHEEKEYQEFLELMQCGEYNAGEAITVNQQLQEAAQEVIEYDSAVERQLIEDGVATHGCHYCGNLFHLSKLRAAEMGLICDNCRENVEPAK
jgi:hypothetical protein